MKILTGNVNLLSVDAGNEQDKESWLAMKILRGHMEDVYDLSWSPDSLQLLSGSVDNTAMIWNVETGKSNGILGDHKGFVQGVGWDPANKYLATISTDRIFRVFDLETRRVISRSSKCLLPVPQESPFHGKITRLYHDDTLQTFFRRLSFSPDGELIVTPSGICDQEQATSTKPMHMSYIYSRKSLKQPIVVLPSPDQYTLCIKFCPLLFQLKKYNEEKNPPLIPLPYRMIFAVATKSCVFLYDTQQSVPFGIVSNIHYTRLTDLTWSNDGRVLVVSSTDGFCSLITFSENELGEIYDDTEVKRKLQDVQKTNKKKKSKGKKKKENTEDQKANKLGSQEEVVQVKENEILSKIIKSDEKFSPQKKDRPLTPIAIRRHPRVLDSPAKTEEPAKGKTPKKPTPIAVRRQPRSLILTGRCEVPDEEEAVDAWPIGTDQPQVVVEKPPPVQKMVCDGDMGHTVDIKLVMEVDSQTEDEGEEKKAEVDETKKTPRRVPLITISTPKSKKKQQEQQ